MGRKDHPCLRCGACCTYFRVQFYWRETRSQSTFPAVPDSLAEDLDDFRKCMKGTNQKTRMRCVALQGRVGDYAFCSIYLNRPSPCRDFKASYSEGKVEKRCDEARAARGLKPLRLEDWQEYQDENSQSLEL